MDLPGRERPQLQALQGSVRLSHVRGRRSLSELRPHEGFPRLRLELGKLGARVGRRFREKAWARLFNTMTVVTLLNGSR